MVFIEKESVAGKTFPSWAAPEPISLRRTELDPNAWHDESKPLPPLAPNDWVVLAVNGREVFWDLQDDENPVQWASYEAALYEMKQYGMPLAIEFGRARDLRGVAYREYKKAQQHFSVMLTKARRSKELAAALKTGTRFRPRLELLLAGAGKEPKLSTWAASSSTVYRPWNQDGGPVLGEMYELPSWRGPSVRAMIGH